MTGNLPAGDRRYPGITRLGRHEREELTIEVHTAAPETRRINPLDGPQPERAWRRPWLMQPWTHLS
jgi:hypothetical protein